MTEIIELKTKEILFLLHKIKGSKIVTITVTDENKFTFQDNSPTRSQAFDISENGFIGYNLNHEKLLFDLISLGIKNVGGMIIRQFLDEKIERIVTNGRKILIPKKNIYAIGLGGNTYKIMNSKQVEEACNTDFMTKEKLPNEENVSYKELEIDLLA